MTMKEKLARASDGNRGLELATALLSAVDVIDEMLAKIQREIDKLQAQRDVLEDLKFDSRLDRKDPQ